MNVITLIINAANPLRMLWTRNIFELGALPDIVGHNAPRAPKHARL
jgi:hypothetical protein